jgi:hypothetical protein
MASIRKEFRVATPIDKVWDALGDFHAVHAKLARGFVVDSQPEEDGAVRAITFANGMKARERKVTVDPALGAQESGPTCAHESGPLQCAGLCECAGSMWE